MEPSQEVIQAVNGGGSHFIEYWKLNGADK